MGTLGYRKCIAYDRGWVSKKIRVIRKPGERYCPDCIQERHAPKEKDLKRLHAWSAVGYNFKSDLHFYKVPGNSNGKMSLQIYKDEILEKVVKPWLDQSQDFILEEDGDSGHGTGRENNIVRIWKQKNGLRYYFNTPGSPDLSPIENCWRAPKENIAQHASWDEEKVRELVIEGWERLSQETINSWVDSMPQRMRDILKLEGIMTGW